MIISAWRTVVSGGIQTTPNTVVVSTLLAHILVSTSSTDVRMRSTIYATTTCQLINTKRNCTIGFLDLACLSIVVHSVTSHTLSLHTIQVAALKANLPDFMVECIMRMVHHSLNMMVQRKMNCTGWKEILIYHRCPMLIRWWRNTWKVIAAWTHQQGALSTVDAASRQLAHELTLMVWRCHVTETNQKRDLFASTVDKTILNELHLMVSDTCSAAVHLFSWLCKQ